jgi:hypothetical protein
MNSLDLNNPTFSALLERVDNILASLRSMRDVDKFDAPKMFDLHDELSNTLTQISELIAGWKET